MVTLGIDGGLTGAIAFMFEDGTVAIDDLPTIELPGEGLVRRRVHGPALSKLLTARCAGMGAVRGAIEALATGGRVNQSQAATNGSQYRTRGTIEAVLELRAVPYREVYPQTWKGMYGLANEKGDSLAIARRLFPEVAAEYLTRAKDHNRAEALLIANYALKAVTW